MAEADFDVDAAGAEFDKNKEQPPAGDHVDDDPGDGGGADDVPPGFKSYEDYIADGGDPDMYVGKSAFEARYENIQENKSLKRELKGVKETVQQTMEAVQEWQTIERKKMREELEAKLHQAMEDEDPKAAVAAQEELNDLADEPPPAQDQPKPEHPVIASFRDENPMLDIDADEWDEEFNADVEGFYNAIHAQLSMGGRKALTDGQIKRCLRQSMKQAQDLHELDTDPPPGNSDAPKRGESPRNNRRGGQQRGRRTRQPAAKPRAEDFTITNPRNPRQKNAASEVRDMIKEKYGDEAATKFEENLAR